MKALQLKYNLFCLVFWCIIGNMLVGRSHITQLGSIYNEATK